VRIGQTSAIHFGSQIISSLAGFVATLYIARGLGSGTLGTFAVFVAVIIWSKALLGGGIQEAVTKRMSEQGGGGGDLAAGIVVQATVFLPVVVLLSVFTDRVNGFLGFKGASLLAIGLSVLLALATGRAALRGEQKVHVAALLRPVEQIVSSGIQLGVVLLGLLGGGVVGLIWGYIAGAAIAGIAGLTLLGTQIQRPTRENFRRVIGFTRYAWLSGIEERSFSAMDTVVLGVFVSSTFIGYYEVAWNVASILAIFGVSLAQTLFPAMSELDSADEREAVADLVNDGVAYTGLFLLPGLVGAVVVGEHVLGIYGTEFRQGALVMVILVIGRLIYAYEAQLTTTLNAIDEPGAAFRVNLVFVLLNLGLNVGLVALYGWVGAAVGTTVSAAVGLIVAYRAVTARLSVTIPALEIGRQAVAAIIMGGGIYALESVLVPSGPASMFETLVLVGAGAGAYFVLLGAISSRFRTTLLDNVPV
jgi:O-antigen/teichoic acid export membrane protein